MPSDHEMPSWEVMVTTAERLLPQVTAQLTGPGSARPGTPAWRRSLARADSLLRVLGGDALQVFRPALMTDSTADGMLSTVVLRDAVERFRRHLCSSPPHGPRYTGALVRRVLAATVSPPLVCGTGRSGGRFWQRELTVGLTLLRAGHEQERAWVNVLDDITADLVCELARVSLDGDLSAGEDRLAREGLVDEAEELLCVMTVDRFWIDPWFRSAVALAHPELSSDGEKPHDDLFGVDRDPVEIGSGPVRGHTTSSGDDERRRAFRSEPDDEQHGRSAQLAEVEFGSDQSRPPSPHDCRPLTALLPSGARRSRGFSRRRFG